MSIAPPLELLPDDLVERITSFPEAVAVARGMGRRKPSAESLAASLGVQASQWSRIANKPKDSPAYMPEHLYGDLAREFGNVGVIQWIAAQVGMRLVPIAETRAQRLRRELAALESEVA